jgi:hypothetical protein
VHRPSGLNKVDGSTSTFRVENVSWKRLLIIDLNPYQTKILDYMGKKCKEQTL